MSTTEEFLNLCKELEQVVEARYGRHQSAYHTIMRMQEYRKYWQDIDVIREIRNLYQHNVVEVEGREAMRVTQDTCDTLRKIINLIQNPPLIRDVYTQDVVWASATETIDTVARRMYKKKVAHVPILDERKRLIGVFSKTTLFQIIMGGQELSSLRDHMLKEFEVETDIRNHQSESFGFIGLNSLQDEALKRFGKVYENDKRLAALYVTEHGKPSEAVLGVVTPWDIL